MNQIVCIIILTDLSNYVMSHTFIYITSFWLHICIIVHDSFLPFHIYRQICQSSAFMQIWSSLVIPWTWANTFKLSTKTWASAKEKKQKWASFTISCSFSLAAQPLSSMLEWHVHVPVFKSCWLVPVFRRIITSCQWLVNLRLFSEIASEHFSWQL